MKLFKNRGDYYIPKNSHKQTREERILIILLVFVILITAGVAGYLVKNYDSVAEFIGENEDIVITTEVNKDETKVLPEISGITNYLILESDANEKNLHYVLIIEADANAMSYKSCVLSPNTKIDGTSIKKIYLRDGAASLKNKLANYLGIEINYYANFNYTEFKNFSNEVGKYLYNSPNKIEKSGGKGDDAYTLRISEGEQKLELIDTSKLVRYYVEHGKYENANEVVVSALLRIITEDNYNKKDKIFEVFIEQAHTDYTVRDFSNARNHFYVFSVNNESIAVYNVNAKYDEKNNLTAESIKEIKGYLS